MRLQPVLTTLCLALTGALTVPLAAMAAAPAERSGAAVKVPRNARAVDTSHPDRWVGNGTPRSCTSRALVRAVAKGGIIRFRCGAAGAATLLSSQAGHPEPATSETAKGGQAQRPTA